LRSQRGRLVPLGAVAAFSTGMGPLTVNHAGQIPSVWDFVVQGGFRIVPLFVCSLVALGVGPGCEVVTSGFTYFATVEAILWTGAQPVFADIEAGSFNLDPGALEAALGPRTRAILPVHLFGRCADMSRIRTLADRHGMLCRQAHDRDEADLPGREGEQEQIIDPTVRKLQEELNGIKQNLTRAQEATINQSRQRVMQDVESFASDKNHPYFDEVADDIAAMIQVGHDLESAYEKAVWANPVTRQKELARLQTEQQASIREKAMKEADIAKKAAGLNVRNRDTSRTPTGPKATMRNLDSALEESMRELKSRTH